MNFYIGNNIDAVILEDKNVELIDELFEYLTSISNKMSVDFSPICNIDPYDDVCINVSEVQKIADLCEVIISQKILEDYDEPDEGYEMIRNLLDISNEAISAKCGMISIGD